ncbi:MAG: glycoside hydrolase family 57 [Phycisphaerae bacterium]|nr:glycoside hydrolase family 57 [Phycisphaerae bacterium]
MSQAPKIVFLPHGNLQYSQLPPEKRGWVIENCYERLFDLVAKKEYKIGFEASGFTVDAIAELNPRVMKKLRDLIAAGQVEPVASPYIHMMLSNIDPQIGLLSLVEGREAWRRNTGVTPSLGWNPECGWASYIPEIFREAGFESLVMDGDSFFLSFPEIRQAAGLQFDVKGHSNKDKLFRIEDYIADKPQFLRYLTNPSVAPNGLKLLFRSDMLANPMLWRLMGATEGVREQPVQIEEIEDILKRWKDRIERTGAFVMPFAEDAEYIGSSAYFYVKQFGQARFFEPEPESVTRFEQMLDLARQVGYELATPSEALAAGEAIENSQIVEVENGVAWHGGTAKAWANTPHARILDPVCRMIYEGICTVAAETGKTVRTLEGPLKLALRRVTAAYVSDSRWPPAPTSPGRFNVRESLDDLFAANDALGEAMEKAGLATKRSLYSPQLMRTQIQAAEAELESLSYFGEK